MIIRINKTIISENSPTYFIADIGANHDGSLLRAKKLIRLAYKAGANAVKFQHFKAETIVNKEQFDKKKKKGKKKKKKKKNAQGNIKTKLTFRENHKKKVVG